MPQDFHCLPTDDLTDEQKEKERQKDEARRAAFAEKKRVEAAMKKRTIWQRPKHPSRKASPGRRHLPDLTESEGNMAFINL